jgi:adenosylcobinamide-phosphate synthase
MLLFDRPIALLLSLALDAVIGDPEAISRRQLHPVQLIGRVIAWADARFNLDSDTPGRRRNQGAWTVIGLVAGALVVGWIIQTLLLALPLGWLWLALAMSTLIAQRSL